MAVQNLVAKAFCLEAIADKRDCTGRHKDLPGKPLEDFVIAGINSSRYFHDLAVDRQNGSKQIYTHYSAALKASNQHKSPKYVNFGLLEIMQAVVCARLDCNKPGQIIATLQKVLDGGTKDDVKNMMKARKIAWSTSTSSEKYNLRLSLETSVAKSATSPADFYQTLRTNLELDNSSRQWVDQYRTDWPILKELFDGLMSSKEPLVLDRITSVFNPLREKHQNIKIGILADMCAAAIFLYLSFTE